MSTPTLVDLLPAYLGRQRWFAGSAPATVRVVAEEALGDGVAWMLVEADGATYQMVLGSHLGDTAPESLAGRDYEVVGLVDGHTVFDALADPDMARLVLARVAPGETADVARSVGAEQSNTSLVFDERVILKLFRHLHNGPNPDIEVTTALAAQGFAHVAEPLGVWRRGDADLAVCARYLAGGAEGWALALASLRDLYATHCDDPADCGGDFGAEARRLGEVTAGMHLALAAAFGAHTGTPSAWAAAVETQLARLGPGDAKAASFVRELAAVGAGGAAVRVHGDYHLGQVIRTDNGWFVLDFEGEPARPLAERRVASSPLKDVAGMLRSFSYAAHVALRERDEAEQDERRPQAEAWEARNRTAFLKGYEGTDGIDDLLPPAGADRQVVLAAFEMDKAVYEILYERDHRPDWVDIPTEAVRRLLDG